MKWTEAQSAAIELRDKNILVSAAAGSGKTAVLVERMKRLILEEGVSLNEMLIVTFSNAAAAEMKAKIISAIDKEMETNQQDQDFLRKQLGLIYKANISTFHAFAMEVIRRYFHFIGIEPNFRICDEAQKTILQAEAMEQLFSELFQAKDADFFDFLQHFSGSKNENPVKDMIDEVHRFIQSVPKPFEWLSACVEALQQPYEDFLKSSAGLELGQCIVEDLELTADYLGQVHEMLEENNLEELAKKAQIDLGGIEGILTDLQQAGMTAVEAALRQMGSFTFQRFVAKKEEKEAYAEIKDEIGAIRDRAKAVFKKIGEQYGQRPLGECVAELQQTYPQARCLERMVQRFDTIYKEKKEKKGVIDFSDIEHFALDILEHEEAASEYRAKFRYIFVDEYQDSNIVQETLIDRIRRDNNVFMVGDVKQSIYKFRLAEPELFIAKYERYRAGDGKQDCKVDLNCNFRSKREIIGGINHIFERIMNVRTTGMAYDDAAALHVGVDSEPLYDYPIALHLIDDSASGEEPLDEEIAEMKRIEVEAYTAAQILKEAYGKKIYDNKKNCERLATYGDMVVLLRSAKTTGQIYFQAFTEVGIPCFADNSDGYFDTVEIQVFLNLLRVIDNGAQDIPLLSVMRSAIFQFDLDEMAVIRIAARRVPYYQAMAGYAKEGEDALLRAKVQETLEKLHLWQSQSTYMPLEDFLWKLLQETGYERFVSAIPGGSQRRANLKALIDRAVQYQTTQMKGLFGFIRYIEAMQKQKVSTGEVRLIGEHDDVVRIMTIHKSKGLEFPIVLLGGLGKKLGGGRGLATMNMNRDLGLALRLVEPKLGIYSKTLLQALIDRRRKKEDMAEEIRILYVAFTRAMDQLILLGSMAALPEQSRTGAQFPVLDVTAAKSYLDLLLPAWENGRLPYVVHDRSEMSRVKQGDRVEKNALRMALEQGFSEEREPVEPKGEQEEGDDAWKQELVERFLYQYPYAGRTQTKSKYTVSELTQKKNVRDRMEMPQLETDVEGLMPKFLETEQAFTGAQRGTILHSILEFIPFQILGGIDSESQMRAEIDRMVGQMIDREMLSKEQAMAVNLKLITTFFLSDMGKRVCAADELYKETPFNMKLRVQEEDALVQGVIDCYFREGDSYVLLDYKSNVFWQEKRGTAEEEREKEEAFERELKEMYEPQLLLYQQALQRIRGISVRELYLYSFALGRAVRVV